jgi:hypothetical protein
MHQGRFGRSTFVAVLLALIALNGFLAVDSDAARDSGWYVCAEKWYKADPEDPQSEEICECKCLYCSTMCWGCAEPCRPGVQQCGTECTGGGDPL